MRQIDKHNWLLIREVYLQIDREKDRLIDSKKDRIIDIQLERQNYRYIVRQIELYK